MKASILASSILAIFVLGATVARANSSYASDNASNPAYSGGWANGSDGGSGWGGDWQLTASGGSAGFFIGDSTGNAGGHSGGINTSGNKAWGMYANSGDLASAVRPFPGAMLSNQTFNIAMDNGWIGSGGPSVGFALQDSNGTNRFEFYFAGGDTQYRIYDSRGYGQATSIGWTAVGLNLSFTLTDTNKYSLSVVVVGTTTTNTFTGTLGGVSGSGITQAYLYNYNAGSGSQYDAYFNSISLVCGTAAPSISSQPVNQAVCLGSSVAESVTGSGTGLSYTWRRNGAGWGGFGPWAISNTSTSTTQNGEAIQASGTAIDTAGASWQLYANSGQIASAVRPFNNALPTNETVSINMANGFVSTGASVGFGLQDANGTNRFEFFFTGGGTNYLINDANNVGGVTPVGYTTNGLIIQVTLTNADSYVATIIRLANASTNTISGTLEGVSGSAITQMRLFNAFAGSGSAYDLYFNSLQLTAADCPGNNIIIKSDNAGDPQYVNRLFTGVGGGWQLHTTATNGSNGGFFIGSSTAPGLGGNIDTGGSSWGLYANNGNLSEAIRLFNDPLQSNQTFAVDMENNDVDTGESVGFGLRDSNNTNRFEFFFGGGNSDYSINDNSGTRDTGIGWTPLGLNLAFTLTGVDSYSLVVSAAGTNSIGGLPKTITGTLEGVAGNLIDRMRLFNFDAGTGTIHNLYFNLASVGAKSDDAADPAYNGGWVMGSNGGQSLTNTTASFTISSAAPGNSGNYDVIVADTCSRSATSSVAYLAVTAPPVTLFSSPTLVCASSTNTAQVNAVLPSPVQVNVLCGCPITGTSGLILANDGNFYGTDMTGGNGYGTIFKITPSGTLTSVFTFFLFTNTDSSGPTGIIQANDGNFYGTTVGYLFGPGSVFKMTPSGVVTTLLGFASNDSDGFTPGAPLILGTDGNMYGITYLAGNLTTGTAFQITTAGTLTTLHQFAGGQNAAPSSSLFEGSDGYFYGTTFGGGTSSNGSVFKVSSTGTFTTLYSFTGGTDGAHPYAGVVQGTDGNYYGTTSSGGTNEVRNGPISFGTVFNVSSNGTFTTVYIFTGYADGGIPETGLFLGNSGYLYGTTTAGGNLNLINENTGLEGFGTVFTISPSGQFAAIADYNTNGVPILTGSSSATPGSSVVQSSTETFYGTGNGNVFQFTAVPYECADYSWSVTNGTIITGQDTSSITWSASSSTNSAADLCVTVTTAAGCSTGICASVAINSCP